MNNDKFEYRFNTSKNMGVWVEKGTSINEYQATGEQKYNNFRHERRVSCEMGNMHKRKTPSKASKPFIYITSHHI